MRTYSSCGIFLHTIGAQVLHLHFMGALIWCVDIKMYINQLINKLAHFLLNFTP